MSRLKDICIDCRDPWTLAHWWAPVLDYVVRPHSEEDLAQLRDDGFSGPEDDPSIATDPASGVGPSIWFNRVPEPKRGKNRVHLDGPSLPTRRATSSASFRRPPSRSTTGAPDAGGPRRCDRTDEVERSDD